MSQDMKPVSTLRELRSLSETDPRYEALTKIASQSLGARKDVSLHDHHQWLRIYALATTEEGVVAQVNSCIPQVGDRGPSPFDAPHPPGFQGANT
jgi:tRNA U34 5-methylaminomethyl-2-thiouridine-forming methyltransferase MnmC